MSLKIFDNDLATIRKKIKVTLTLNQPAEIGMYIFAKFVHTPYEMKSKNTMIIVPRIYYSI